MSGVISKELYDINSEAAVLGSILLENKLAINAIDEGISKSDFYYEEHGIMFEIMKTLFSQGNPIDLVSVKTEFDKLNYKINLSNITDLANIAIPGNIDYYIKQVKEKTFKRVAYIKASEFLEKIKSCKGDEIKGAAEELAKSIDLSSSIENLISDASDIKRTDLTSGLYTGIESLDKVTAGLVYGSLTILTGEPSSGKSTLLNQIIAFNLMNNNRAMIYSGELTGFNVLQWFMRTVANIEDLKEFRTKVGAYYDVTQAGEFAIREWIKNRLYIYNEEAIASVQNICNSIEFLARNKNVKLFILDNMMTIENSGLEELDKQKELAKRLKNIARKYKVCVILVAHPKKKLNTERNKYHMHDVSGASEVVNLADYEFLLTRDISTDSEGKRIDETNIAVMKNRITGKQGIKMLLNFDSTRKRFWTNKKELNIDYSYKAINQVGFVEVNDVPASDVPF